MKMKILGIDLAWKSENNTTAIAIGELTGKEFHVFNIQKSLSSIDSIKKLIDRDSSIYGISIDAPLVVNNDSGQRVCENELSREYGSRKASCHTTNKGLYPDASSIKLANHLLEGGFNHLGDPLTERWQIECYPHPAIIEIFGLSERLSYKKGKVLERIQGQVILADYISRLNMSSILRLTFDSSVQELLSRDNIEANVGRRRKEHEDALDAIICAYIGALYAISATSKIFGSVETGYIYVPQQKCI